jgi:hypothetical protein
MKSSLQIIAIIDEPELLEGKVEQLAHRHHDSGCRVQNIAANSTTLETSSVESYVSGYAVMNDPEEQISAPFVTRFVFTCIKINDGVYKLEWSSSLS